MVASLITYPHEVSSSMPQPFRLSDISESKMAMKLMDDGPGEFHRSFGRD